MGLWDDHAGLAGVPERAVRMVFDQAEECDSQRAAIRSIADKIGSSLDLG